MVQCVETLHHVGLSLRGRAVAVTPKYSTPTIIEDIRRTAPTDERTRVVLRHRHTLSRHLQQSTSLAVTTSALRRRRAERATG
jgi:hypothetical protein